MKILTEPQLATHKGVFKPQATVAEAVFMITGMTIGAGVLGLPYAVAQVGLAPGLIMIGLLGLVMLSLNLMVGEIAVRTNTNMQLPGLAGRYLGPVAKSILSVTIIFSSYGVLLAYLIGEGVSLAQVFGGDPIVWTVIFWSVGSFLVWGGLKRIKFFEKIFSLTVIGIIAGLSLFLLPHFDWAQMNYLNSAKMLFPLGVILFALHATPAVAEAHALLPGSQKHFKKVLIIGTFIPIVVYLLFTAAVVGFSGLSTTEVATVGIGAKFGPVVLVLANVFAVLAMCTGFMGLGTALRETLEWDFGIKKMLAKFLVISIPITLFLLGLRSFIKILDLVGGLFIAIEAIMVVLIYYQARKKGDFGAERYNGLRHPAVVALPILLLFVIVAIASVYNFVR